MENSNTIHPETFTLLSSRNEISVYSILDKSKILGNKDVEIDGRIPI